MSLRAEIHDAIDEVAPSAPQLPKKVELYVLADHRRQIVVLPRRPSQWAKPFRGTISLVAAALVVALIGGLILGGRIWRDLHSQPPTINQAELKRLEARPLRAFPTVQPGGECPTSPLTDVSAHSQEALLFGEGPVYSTHLGYGAVTTSWGTWTVLSLEVDTTKTSGLILIRAKDLQTNAEVVFARNPLSATGQAGDGTPTGRASGRDVVLGQAEQVYPKLVLDLSRPYPGTKTGQWPIFKSFMGYPKTAMGCVGFQVDGTNFSELVVVS